MQDKFSAPGSVTALRKLFTAITFREKLAAGLFVFFGPVFLVTYLSRPTDESPIAGLLWTLVWLLAHGIAVLIASALVFFTPKRSGSDRNSISRETAKTISQASLALRTAKLIQF